MVWRSRNLVIWGVEGKLWAGVLKIPGPQSAVSGQRCMQDISMNAYARFVAAIRVRAVR